MSIVKGTNCTKEIVNDRRWVFIESFQVATPIIRAVRSQGGDAALELPGGNAYWNESPIQTWMNEFKIATTKIHGCIYGLLAKFGPHVGERLLKTWINATTSEPLRRQVNLLCNHQCKHPPFCGKHT